MSSTIINIGSIDIIKHNIIPTAEIRAFYLHYDNIIMPVFGIVVGEYNIIDSNSFEGLRLNSI